jgi:polyphosphate kinase 2 (PPK2 family)
MDEATADKLAAEKLIFERVHREMVDSFDEELEMELKDEPLPDKQRPKETEEEEAEHLRFRRFYFRELFRLQGELVKLQEWVVASGHKLVILFEGRDAAGKGGAIKRITQRLNPRVCRVAALPAPNNRERTQWYFQRYVAHLPAAGEIVCFDRSWYNRAGVERVMAFCTDEGVNDPLKQWKLSPMDLESRRRWEDYTLVKEIMFERTHIPEAPWWIVHGVDKKRARLNCIHHLLNQVPYQPVPHDPVVLPQREHHAYYHRKPNPPDMVVPELY